MARYYLGCGSWANRDWVGRLFSLRARPGDFLRQYSSAFSAVEGNSTFYGLPSRATAVRWKSETPEGFRFCFKFPREVSHGRRLRNAQAETGRFLDALSPLVGRLGPLFLQMPPSFAPRDLPLLDRFLATLPRGFQYAVEVRDPAFFGSPGAELHAILARRATSRVILDNRSALPPEPWNPPRKGVRPVPLDHIGTSPLIRFVGHPETEHCLALLRQWAQVFAHWVQGGLTPYFFAHTADDLHAPLLARAFHRLVAAHADVGNLPRWAADDDESQLDLFHP